MRETVRPAAGRGVSWSGGLLFINVLLVAFTQLLLWMSHGQSPLVIFPNLVHVINNLSISVIALAAARLHWPDKYMRRGCLLIAAAGLFNAVADVIWTLYRSQGRDTFPSPADIFYLGFYPSMFVGILQFIRPPRNPADRALFWIDLGIVAISAAALVWYLQLRALIQPDQQSLAQSFLSLAYPLGSILLLLGAFFWWLRPRPAPGPLARYWLVAGLLTFLATDLGYTVQQATEQYREGGLPDRLYYLSLLMLMTGVWSALREETPGDLPVRPRLEATVAAMPYLAISAIYGLLLATAFGWSPAYLASADRETGLMVLISVGSLLTALLLIRQAIATQEAARLRAQQTIEQHERRFAALAHHSSDLILLVDEQLRPHFVSQSFEHLLGCKPPAAGGSILELIHPEDQQQAIRLIARALLTPDTPISGLWRMRHAEGTWRDIEILATNLSHNPAVGGIALNGRDVTERRRYEQALEKARAEAESASRAKDLFLANMSHEIRTPLQAILGFIDFLLASPLAPQQRDYLERMRETGRSLHTLINDILDYSRLTAGQLYLESIPLRLTHLIDRCRALFELQARQKGLELSFVIDPGVPKRLRGDPLRLLQILNNLVGNAIRFTPQGGVWVEVSCLNQTPVSALIEFRVRDTGIGLTPRQCQRIFDPFQQADASISRRYGGSGLGLSICKRLVELMGGEIGVESKAGEGSTFWFRVLLEKLPLAPEEGSAPDKLPPNLLIEYPDPADPQPPPAACALPPCPEPIRKGLAELAVLLEAQNSRARHLSRELLNELQGTPWQAEYEPIAQAIAALDFESARQRLRRLLG